MDSSDFKGCGWLFAVCAAGLILGGCFKRRDDAREIGALTKLVEQVHTLLEKGKVRQAKELLEDRKREMDQQAARDADRFTTPLAVDS